MRPLLLVTLLVVLGVGRTFGAVISGSDYYKLDDDYQRGYLHAFVDSLLFNKPADYWANRCIHSDMTTWQIGDILATHLKTHPDELHRPIQIILWAALSETCGELGYK